ncbi:MAG: efflux RND transporter periplasmic adaptor subunit [Hyphomicrobiaceae bacterium]
MTQATFPPSRSRRAAATTPWLACVAAALLVSGIPAKAQTASGRHTVTISEVDDVKSVLATVRSKDRIEARVRTPGTIVTLQVQAGVSVKAGQPIAVVADPKIALRIKAVDAQILGIESRLATARLDLERAEQLRARGVTPQARVDQLKTAVDVAANELKAARAERLVIEQQATEGQVLAPADGRVLKVPVTVGSVVLPGESIATIAANAYLLRIELPERHARFLRKGDPIRVNGRGLATGSAPATEGRIVQVYPELEGGRVIADADVPGLGDYFVGERALVWISAGKRKAVVIPAAFVFSRFGLELVRLVDAKGQMSDLVVQTGAPSAALGSGTREVLAGLGQGDVLALPDAAK